MINTLIKKGGGVKNRITSCSHHHAALEDERFITNAESTFTCSSGLICSILSLDHSKTSSNQELCKSSHNRLRDYREVVAM